MIYQNMRNKPEYFLCSKKGAMTMKTQFVKLLLTLPIMLLLVASDSASLTENLKFSKNDNKINSAYTEARVNLKPQLFAWGYSARRKGRTEECTWLGINCN